MGRSVACVTVGVLVVGVLAGCGGGGEEPLGLSTVTAEPTQEVTPSPLPSTGGPVDRSDEAVGIVFEDLPEVTGDALKALDTLTLYELEERRATTTGVFDPSIAMFASPDVVALVQGQVDGNAESGWTVGGVLVSVVDIVDADAHTAHATVCRDASDVLYTNAGATYTAADVGLTDRAFFEVVMSRLDDTVPWMVESYERNGTC
jgi:hypothetical protein